MEYQRAAQENVPQGVIFDGAVITGRKISNRSSLFHLSKK